MIDCKAKKKAACVCERVSPRKKETAR